MLFLHMIYVSRKNIHQITWVSHYNMKIITSKHASFHVTTWYFSQNTVILGLFFSSVAAMHLSTNVNQNQSIKKLNLVAFFDGPNQAAQRHLVVAHFRSQTSLTQQGDGQLATEQRVDPIKLSVQQLLLVGGGNPAQGRLQRRRQRA